MFHVIYAKENYIFDESCKPMILNSYTTEKGLCYIFEADSKNEAEKKAMEFIKELNNERNIKL